MYDEPPLPPLHPPPPAKRRCCHWPATDIVRINITHLSASFIEVSRASLAGTSSVIGDMLDSIDYDGTGTIIMDGRSPIVAKFIKDIIECGMSLQRLNYVIGKSMELPQESLKDLYEVLDQYHMQMALDAFHAHLRVKLLEHGSCPKRMLIGFCQHPCIALSVIAEAAVLMQRDRMELDAPKRSKEETVSDDLLTKFDDLHCAQSLTR